MFLHVAAADEVVDRRSGEDPDGTFARARDAAGESVSKEEGDALVVRLAQVVADAFGLLYQQADLADAFPWPVSITGRSASALRHHTRSIRIGGIAVVAGIPALLAPQFIDADQADFIKPDDLVIGVTISGQPKAYPIKILNWHEVVNDTVGGVPVASTVTGPVSSSTLPALAGSSSKPSSR